MLVPFAGTAQSKYTYIHGKVTDSHSKRPLHKTNISIKNTITGCISNKSGSYHLKVKKKKEVTIIYSFVGYKSQSKNISLKTLLSSDTLVVNMQLDIQLEMLPTFTFGVPETVFGSRKFSVSDFEFYDDKFIFLTYEKNIRRGSRVILTDKREQLLSSLTIPEEDEAVELFKDYKGYVNIICKNAVYRVAVERNLLMLLKLPKDDFDAIIKPCIDTLNGDIVFTDYRWHFPEFNYYLYDPIDSNALKIKHVIDEQLSQMYRYEYYFLNSRDKLEARRTALNTGTDKHEVAAWMTGFPYSLYYNPLYAPLFVVDDTILVFDHYQNKLYRYDELARPIDSIDIVYHQKPKAREWKKQLIIDELNDNIYTLYQKSGYYYIKKINTGSGKAQAHFRLAYKYVEHIKIKDDYVYYIYRPFESVQKKYLYRELIIEN